MKPDGFTSQNVQTYWHFYCIEIACFRCLNKVELDIYCLLCSCAWDVKHFNSLNNAVCVLLLVL